MNELGIYVFSGTGNTLKCAEALQEALAHIGICAGFHEIADGTEYAGEKDMILCYPVHGFNAPNMMLRFCRELPAGDDSIWFLKTSGEPLSLNDNSSGELSRILERKGYYVRGEFHYVMPYNIIFRHRDELASLMWKTAQERIPKAAEQIAEGIGKTVSPGIPAEQIAASPGIPAKVMSRLCRIEHWFYPKNGKLYRVDRNRCDQCMKCVKDCPAGNISYAGGKFRFGRKCTGCMRCSFRCPKGAIHIGLLDLMRVNGPYDLTVEPKEALPGRYCKKAYRRYFHGRSF